MRNPFLDLLSDVDVGSSTSTFWATVVATNPLRVQRDAEQMLGVTPKTLERLELGDRVLCLRDQRQLIVLGKLGGPEIPAPFEPPNGHYIWIDGKYWLASGSVKPPAFTWARTDGAVYSTTVAMPQPYAPPFPYTFNWSMQESSGYSSAANAERLPSGGTQNVRLMQIGNASTTAISRLQWQLVNA